ncbi:MAG: hypothetical protein ACLQIQ_04945 [Beijerinckiaceae bacterium]
MRVRRIFPAACLAAFVLTGLLRPACAGALLAPPGEGEIITTASFSSSTRAFDAQGKLIPIPAYDKFELASYIEYGVDDKLTLVARPSFSVYPSGAADPRDAASADLGARLSLFSSADTAISLQDILHLPANPTAQQTNILDDETVFGDELSLLATRSFTIGSHAAFIDVAGGYRWQQWLPDEWHADATFGIRPLPQFLWLFQSFATISRSTAAFASYSSLKLQVSAVYDLSRAFSVQLSLFETVAGRNSGRELGPVAGLWYRF